MLFNSLIFLVFFAIVYSLYLLTQKKYKVQNLLLLVASYVFYGYWDWRFLSLLAISTIVDFIIGGKLHKTILPGRRKLLLAISVIVNLSILGFFKYFNFFAENLTQTLNLFGMQPDPITLRIILPVGISFYTFQTMSYTIDIYRRKLVPTHSLLDFALFVSFFPQLVAGPIERAVHLLPQLSKPRKLDIDQINAALFLLVWGYFKKIVIADNVGAISDHIFNTYTTQQGLNVLIGTMAFCFQIYCDFSAYSDIARGLAKLMGIDLMINFKLPYFALNPSDFWRRWHISLSSWLRDYLYIPLGGNRGGKFKTYRNLSLTMLLGGLWHGASWNFVIWGAFHGGILILYHIYENLRHRADHHINPWHKYPAWRVLLSMAAMFGFTLIGWIIFRSQSVHQILYMISHMGWQTSPDSMELGYKLIFFILPLIVVQILQYRSRDLLVLMRLKLPGRVVTLGLMLTAIILFNSKASIEFIYFQF